MRRVGRGRRRRLDEPIRIVPKPTRDASRTSSDHIIQQLGIFAYIGSDRIEGVRRGVGHRSQGRHRKRVRDVEGEIECEHSALLNTTERGQGFWKRGKTGEREEGW